MWRSVYLVTLDNSRGTPNHDSGITSSGALALPYIQKQSHRNQELHALLHQLRQLKAISAATREFVLAILCSGQKAEVLRDLNAAFPCIPELETFRSVLDNKT